MYCKHSYPAFRATIPRQDVYQCHSQGHQNQAKESESCSQQAVRVRKRQRQALRPGGHQSQGGSQRYRGGFLRAGQAPGGWRRDLPQGQGARGQQQEAGRRGGPPGPKAAEGEVHGQYRQELLHHQDRAGAAAGGHQPNYAHPKPGPDETGGRGTCRGHLLLSPNKLWAHVQTLQLQAGVLLPCSGGGHQVGQEQRCPALLQLCPHQEESCPALRGQDAEEGWQDLQVLHRLRRSDHLQGDPRLQEDQALFSQGQEELCSLDFDYPGAEGESQPGLISSFLPWIWISSLVSVPIYRLAAALYWGFLGSDVVNNEFK